MIHLFGLGNELRHDDGLGILLARALEEEGCLYARIQILGMPGLELLNHWQGLGQVVLVDCLQGPAPGEIHWLNLLGEELEPQVFRHAHGQGIAEAIRMGRALERLPKVCHLFGVAGEDFSLGQGLSPQIQKNFNHYKSELKKRLRSLQ